MAGTHGGAGGAFAPQLFEGVYVWKFVMNLGRSVYLYCVVIQHGKKLILFCVQIITPTYRHYWRCACILNVRDDRIWMASIFLRKTIFHLSEYIFTWDRNLLTRAKRHGQLPEFDSCVCPNLLHLLYFVYNISNLSDTAAKISVVAVWLRPISKRYMSYVVILSS